MPSVSMITKNSFLLMLLLAQRSYSLNMVVQVTVTPKIVVKLLPLCSLSLLELFQPLFTKWVTQATVPVIPDFAIQGVLILTYRNPNGRRARMLRTADDDDDDTNEDGARYLSLLGGILNPPKKPSSTSSCSSCTSAGCSQYCGNAVCTLCASSRRLSSSNATTTTISGDDLLHGNDERNLGVIDFVALGKQVSATLKGLAQNFLLSTIFDLLGCLGDPVFLNTNVTFLVNQTFPF